MHRYRNHEVRANGRLPNVLTTRSPRLADDAPLRQLLAENGFESLEAGFRTYFAAFFAISGSRELRSCRAVSPFSLKPRSRRNTVRRCEALLRLP